MARINSTSGTRFAKSIFLTNNHSSHASAHTAHNAIPEIPLSPPVHQFDRHLAELMEALRLYINNTLHLPLNVQQRSRLVRNYWEVELRVKDMRLLLGSQLLQQGVLQQPSKMP